MENEKIKLGDIVSNLKEGMIYSNHSDAFIELGFTNTKENSAISHDLNKLDLMSNWIVVNKLYNDNSKEYMYHIKKLNNSSIELLISSDGFNISNELAYNEVTLENLLFKYPKLKEELLEYISSKSEDIIESQKARDYWRLKFREEAKFNNKNTNKYIKTGSGKKLN